jgi:hypothetical protein
MPDMVGVAFALLEMLRLQQHSFAPNHFRPPVHSYSVIS